MQEADVAAELVRQMEEAGFDEVWTDPLGNVIGRIGNGKKVLANYVIYMNKLGIKTRIFPLLKTLATPSKTDKFRK